MRRLVSLAIVALVLPAVGCAHRPADPWAKMVHKDVLAKADLQYYWRNDVRPKVRMERGESVREIRRMDENVYLLTSLNRLVALDAGTGVLKWWMSIGTPAQDVFRPTHVNNVRLSAEVAGMAEILDRVTIQLAEPFNAVMVNNLARVLVIDRKDGRIVRDIPFDFAANTGGASDGRSFFVGSTTGLYYSIRLEEAVPFVQFATGSMLVAPLEYYSRNVYVGGTDRRFYARTNADMSEPEWVRDLGGPVTTEFFVGDVPMEGDRQLGACFVPCEDNRLYAFDAATGAELWQRPFIANKPLRDPVQVGRTSIFQYARDDSFYAINLENGLKKWSMPDARKALAVWQGQVYLVDRHGNLLAVDESLGEVSSSVPMTGFELYAANADSTGIWVASKDGKVACIRRISAGHLKPAMLGAQ